MLTALILVIAVAGIVILARRWPDVEAKLWPDEVDVPEREARSEATADDSADSVDEVVAETEPVETDETPSVEKTAGGLMSKKAIATEPDVDEPVSVTAAADDSATDDSDADDDEPASFMDSLPEIETEEDDAPAEPAAAEKPAATPAAKSAPAASPTRAAPKPRVMGEPARPSQPAYVDATKRVAESFEQLSAEADKAWQERSYDKAEQACLKILVQQPKNHKYMTRIGQIYQETGDLEDAKEAFESAKKLDPKNFFVLNRLSEVERMISDKGGRTSLKKPVAK